MKFFAYLSVLLAAVFAAYYVGGSHGRQIAPPSTGPDQRDVEISALRQKISDLEQKLKESRLREQDYKEAVAIIAKDSAATAEKPLQIRTGPKTLAEIQAEWAASSASKRPAGVFSRFRNWTMSEKFAQQFGLGLGQAEAISGVLVNAKTALNHMSAENAVVYRSDGDVVEFRIPPISSGASVYDNVVSNITAIVGPDKAQDIISTAFSDLNYGFEFFGTQERTITIKQQSVMGIPTLYMTDIPKPPGGLTRSDGNLNASFADGSELPPGYEWLNGYAAQLSAIGKKK